MANEESMTSTYCDHEQDNVLIDFDCCDCPHFKGKEWDENSILTIECTYDISLEEPLTINGEI